MYVKLIKVKNEEAADSIHVEMNVRSMQTS